MRYAYLIVLVVLFSCSKTMKKEDVENLAKTRWVDSVYNGMSLQEKVGQLFMLATNVNKGEEHKKEILHAVDSLKIGGVIFFKGSPTIQAKYTNDYQAKSKVPLFVAIDGEWGLNMRLDSTIRYPYNMTLGAIKNNDLIQQIGTAIGKEHKRMGVHINFAPVVDINTNPDNPVIGVRSYGEDKLNVTNKAIAFVKGMQEEGTLACAKHFPGHGDTATDSHLSLPTVNFSKKRMDSIELYPYRQLFKNDIASVMVAHLNVPSLEQKVGLPTTLSYDVVTELLQKQLQFKGLIFTDALNMKGVANYDVPGQVDLDAFKAGNDMLLYSEDMPKAVSKIIEAYQKKEITETRLEFSVKKILSAKYKVGLNNYKPIEITNLVSDLNPENYRTLNSRAIQEAVTIVKSPNHGAFNSLASKKTAFIKLGNGGYISFLDSLKTNENIELVNFKNLKDLQKYDQVLISYHRANYRKTQAISKKELQLIMTIAKKHKVILVAFASQYALKTLDFENIEQVIVSYENTKNAQHATVNILLGTLEAKGVLPASINSTYVSGYKKVIDLQGFKNLVGLVNTK